MLTTWFPTRRNPAAGSFIATDARALASQHDVQVMHLTPPELDDGRRDFVDGGIRVRRIALDVRRPQDWPAIRREVSAAAVDVDILHTMAAPALIAGFLTRSRPAWVHTEHWSGTARLAVGRGRVKLARPLVRRLFSRPDEVVAVSDHLAASVRLLRAGPVTVIGNIVDPAPPRGDPPESAGRSRLRLLGVGAVRENKGWDLAIRALAVLSERGIDAELLWLGDGPEMPRLRELAKGLPVRLPGHVERSRVRDEMSSADMLILPTVSETFSLVTVEALVAGLPVLATGEGAHVEFLTPETGRVVKRDPIALADAALELRGIDREAVRIHGRELSERFSQESFLDRYRKVYERVMEIR